MNTGTKLADLFTIVVTLAVYVFLIYLYGPDENNKINPDFIAYYRNALYWSEGNYELAISGYWGPLFSWLIIPFLGAESSPTASAWNAIYISGALFVVAAAWYFKQSIGSTKYWLFGLLSIAFFTAYWAGVSITADLLFSSLVLIGYSLLLKASQKNSTRYAVLAGIFLGLSYLTKTPGIVLGFGFIIALTVFFYFTGDAKLGFWRKVTIPASIALMIISSAWISVLTLHYGEFTWSTAAGRAQQLTSGKDHENFSIFHLPKKGRISSWEDPTEIDDTERASIPETNNIAGGKLSIGEYLQNIVTNYRYIADLIISPGWAFLLFSGLIAFLIHGGTESRFMDELWRLGLLGSSVIIAPYLLSYANSERYFFVCYPLLLSSAIGLIAKVQDKNLIAWISKKEHINKLVVLVLSVIYFMILWQPIIDPLRWREETLDNTDYYYGRKIAEMLSNHKIAGPVAEIGERHIGLWTAFNLNTQYYGKEMSSENIAFLKKHDAKLLILTGGKKNTVETDSSLENLTDLFKEESEVFSELEFSVYRFD